VELPRLCKSIRFDLALLYYTVLQYCCVTSNATLTHRQGRCKKRLSYCVCSVQATVGSTSVLAVSAGPLTGPFAAPRPAISPHCSCGVPSVLAASAGPLTGPFAAPRWYSMKLAVLEEHLAVAMEGGPLTMATAAPIGVLAMAMAMAIATATVGLPRRQHWS
jgi:hypothetical protein